MDGSDVARLRRNRRAVENLGLPNYFDDQRFGCVAYGQGFVFDAIARCDYELALRRLIATPPEADRGGDARLRGLLQKNWGDWEVCENIARGPMYRGIFSALRRNPEAFAEALDAVPSRLKLIHLYSFQSWIWNRAVSRWIDRRLGEREHLWMPSLSGELCCWRYPNESLAEQLAKTELPLPDHATKPGDRLFAEVLADLWDELGLSPRQLRVQDVQGMRLKEEQRSLLLRPEGLRISSPQRDERNDGRMKVELNFALPRGAYASLVVRRLFADQHPPFRVTKVPARR